MLTLAKNTTDAKLGPAARASICCIPTPGLPRRGSYQQGLTILSAMGFERLQPCEDLPHKWFLDNVQPGTKVLFASECAKASKKHPNEAVRCTFYFLIG